VTKRLCFLFATLAVAPVAVLAQGSAAPDNPISDSEKRVYAMLSSVVIAAAEKMPEASYSFKPTPEVRSFGQLVGHLADSNYFFCSTAAGETTPVSDAEKTKTKKADLIAALKDAVAYCNKAYAAMTDAKGSQLVKMMNLDMARLTVLAANFAHNYEHYGNMATYMRIRGIVPPTSEKGASPGQN
jgi:uncharacterized damage-inducible protein DinB